MPEDCIRQVWQEVNTFTSFYEGGTCKLRESGKSVRFEAHDPILIRTLPDLEEMQKHNDTIFYSQLVNEPFCDAAAILHKELILFQMTIRKQHGFKEPTWNKFCKAAKAAGLDAVRFIFVVPFKDKFRVTQDQISLFQKQFDAAVYLEVAETTKKYMTTLFAKSKLCEPEYF
jgi:hypothetical protein